MYIRERPLTNTPDSSFRNKITNQVNDNNLTSDNTLVVSKYTGGTHISLPNDIDIGGEAVALTCPVDREQNRHPDFVCLPTSGTYGSGE